MKTAMELLGDDAPKVYLAPEDWLAMRAAVELVAQRARDEAREAIKKAVARSLMGEYDDLAHVIDAAMLGEQEGSENT